MRRKNDFYPTPEAAVIALLQSDVGALIRGQIMEPCVGDGALLPRLRDRATDIQTADIDPAHNPQYLADAKTLKFSANWVVTNPPFNQALPILKNCLNQADTGVAMLLRVTFLEPTLDRGPFWQKHPPAKILHLPRISFTGDGNNDSAHAAWFVWTVEPFKTDRPSEWVTREQFRNFT